MGTFTWVEFKQRYFYSITFFSTLSASGCFAEQQSAGLQSDLEDFDLLDSDTSDSEPKPRFLPEDEDANPNSDFVEMELARQTSSNRNETSTLTAIQYQNAPFYPNLDIENANALDASEHPEYPSCMLSSTGSSSPVYPLSMALTKVERRQESPVATLREWVDGVFPGNDDAKQKT